MDGAAESSSMLPSTKNRAYSSSCIARATRAGRASVGGTPSVAEGGALNASACT
jgi:hypothetical protein